MCYCYLLNVFGLQLGQSIRSLLYAHSSVLYNIERCTN